MGTCVAGELGVDELHNRVVEDEVVGRAHEVGEVAVDDLQVQVGELQHSLGPL